MALNQKKATQIHRQLVSVREQLNGVMECRAQVALPLPKVDAKLRAWREELASFERLLQPHFSHSDRRN